MRMRFLALAVAAALGSPAAAVDLTAAIKASVAADPELASALANRDAAQENIPIARARLLPQVSLQSTYQRLNQNTTSAAGVRDYNGPSESIQLTLRQALLRMRDREGLKIGNLQADLGELKLESARADLWNRTSVAWVDVLVAQFNRDIYERTVASVAEAAKQEARRFELGDGTRDAAAEAAAQLAFARGQLADARLEVQTKLLAFNQLTRLNVQDFDGFRMPGLSGPVRLSDDRAELLARIIDNNPDLASARLAEDIARHRLAQAGADHLPTVDLVASANRGKSDSANLVGTSYNNSQVGLQLVLPIYQGGGVNAAQRQGSAALTAATADRESLLNRLTVQFAADWNGQTSLHERIEAAGALVTAAIEQRRAAELGIKAGLRTWADLGAADLQLARRETDRVGLMGTQLKLQARLLAFLPVTDPSWERWVATVAGRSRR